MQRAKADDDFNVNFFSRCRGEFIISVERETIHRKQERETTFNGPRVVVVEIGADIIAEKSIRRAPMMMNFLRCRTEFNVACVRASEWTSLMTGCARTRSRLHQHPPSTTVADDRSTEIFNHLLSSCEMPPHSCKMHEGRDGAAFSHGNFLCCRSRMDKNPFVRLDL